MKSRVTSFPSAASAPRQRADTQEQAEHGRAQKVGDIGQIHRSGRERLEMHRERQIDEQLIEGIGNQMSIFVDDPQQQEDAERQQSRDDLIVGQRRREQAYSDERSTEQHEAEITAENR